MELLMIVLPVFLIFVIGFIGQRKVGFEIKSFSKLYIYILAPFLSFRTFYQNPLSFEYIYMAAYIVLLCVAIIIFVKIIGKIRGYNVKEQCGLILASAFMNNGNYGVPVSLFAFGVIGLDYAVILMIMQMLIAHTVGIYYAAKGSSRDMDMKQAMLAVLKMPVLYGAFAGMIMQLVSIPLHYSLIGVIDLVADAAIPILMLTLGMQLAVLSLKSIPFPKMSLALVLRMAVSPLVAVAIVYVLPVEDILGKVMILTAAMPTAANVTMLSIQFDTEPELVTSTTFFSTLCSLVTIPIVLFFLT